MTETQRLEKKALSLEPGDRARLAQRLLASLEELPEEEVEALWVAEAERRLLQYKNGDVKATAARTVLARVKRQLSR